MLDSITQPMGMDAASTAFQRVVTPALERLPFALKAAETG